MKSQNEPAFTIVDRRGQNRAEEEVPLAHVAQAATSNEAKPELYWKNIAYLIAIQQMREGMALMGRAVGLRGDGQTFVGDYMLFNLVPGLEKPLEDWRPTAKKRLDSFLGCSCSFKHGSCAIHRMYLAQWQKEDIDRVMRLGAAPVPEALEVLHRTEQARRNPQIMVPR